MTESNAAAEGRKTIATIRALLERPEGATQDELFSVAGVAVAALVVMRFADEGRYLETITGDDGIDRQRLEPKETT